ncbi:hypothetical protein J3E68DRAFT_446296 [Trichoderma sp. SZMC 28012]
MDPSVSARCLTPGDCGVFEILLQKFVRKARKHCAADIAANVLSEDNTDRGMRFIHHSSGVKVPILDFKKHLEKLYSGVFEEVTMDEWIGKVLEAGIDPLITSYLQAMAEKEEVIQFLFLGVS